MTLVPPLNQFQGFASTLGDRARYVFSEQVQVITWGPFLRVAA